MKIILMTIVLPKVKVAVGFKYKSLQWKIEVQLLGALIEYLKVRKMPSDNLQAQNGQN